jgi:hypothetical protein
MAADKRPRGIAAVFGYVVLHPRKGLRDVADEVLHHDIGEEAVIDPIHESDSPAPVVRFR